METELYFEENRQPAEPYNVHGERCHEFIEQASAVIREGTDAGTEQRLLSDMERAVEVAAGLPHVVKLEIPADILARKGK